MPVLGIILSIGQKPFLGLLKPWWTNGATINFCIFSKGVKYGFLFITNRKRRVCVWVAPTVFARIKDFAKRYNISTKAAVQVLLQTNLEEWEKGLADLYGKTPPKSP